MRKTIFRRIICAAMTAAMVLPLSSCGKNAAPPKASKENIFRCEEIDVPEDFSYINSVTATEDRIYLIGEKSESSGDGDNFKWSNITSLCILDISGSLIKNIVISEQSSEKQTNTSRYVSKLCADTSGNVNMLIGENTWDPETYESDDKFFIARYDRDGNFLGEIDVTSIKQEANDPNSYFYINNMTNDNDGNIYLTSNDGVYVTDPNGKLIFNINNAESKGSSGEYISSICRTADGRVAALVNSWSSENDDYKNFMTAKMIDLNKKDFSDEYQLNSRWYSFYNGGGNYDLYVSTENSLIGVKLATGESEPVIDWLKSGYDTTAMQNSVVLPDGRILCTGYKYESHGNGISYGGNMVLNMLTKLDPSEVPDKELISISSFYLDYRVRQRIVEFNRESEKYQIEVNNYGDYDDGTGNYDAGLTKMNNDLIAGNIPDIILVNQQMPFDSYVSKGIIADLYKFMDKDETIHREDYLENVLNAMSKNGKLYRITPSFSIQTLVGKTKFVGAEEGWTMQDFLKLSAEHPEMDMFSDQMTKDGFLVMMLYYSMNSYVEPDTGKCNFNTDGFKSLLEAANAYPLKTDDSVYNDDDWWVKRETACREDRALLSTQYFYDFKAVKRCEQATFGEDITFIGYPCDGKNGTVISPGAELAITAKAKNPAGAWEFVRYFISDEYQSQLSGTFPLKESEYGRIMEEAKKKPYYTDENGNEVEYDDVYWLGNSEIKIDPNTDAENERIMNLIKSADSIYSYDEELVKIVSEEAAPYFNGQKTVDEVAEIIQNRVNIYISTNR